MTRAAPIALPELAALLNEWLRPLCDGSVLQHNCYRLSVASYHGEPLFLKSAVVSESTVHPQREREML